MPINKSNIKPFACRVTRINGTRNKLITSNLARKGLNKIMAGIASLAVVVIPTTLSNAYAENVLFTIEANTPSLEISVPPVVGIPITPNSEGVFKNTDVKVYVGTNNSTGYTLMMYTTDETNPTDLKGYHTGSLISTLANKTGGYTENEFTVNKWGYKWSFNGTTSNTPKTNYYPIVSTNAGGNMLTVTEGQGNALATTVTLATKLDNETPTDSYETTLSFVAIANTGTATVSFSNAFYNENISTYTYTDSNNHTVNSGLYAMQDLTPAVCEGVANGESTKLIDKRDNEIYQVTKISGRCWMTENLRFIGTSLNPSTSNVTTDRTMTWYDLKTDGVCDINNGYNNACRHTPDNADVIAGGSIYTAEQIGQWYNYMGATASIISGNNNITETTEDICPTSWKIPSATEMQDVRGVNANVFSPIRAGFFYDGHLDYPESAGRWWASTSVTISARNQLIYDDDLWVANNYRSTGVYIRCIAKNQ